MTITDITYHPIFVYGTLRPNGGNHYLWRGVAEARCDDECYVVGYKLVHNGSFPYLVPAATAQTVGCLIYPTPSEYEATLTDMDSLEGVPAHYRRVAVPVLVTPEAYTRGLPRLVTAWTYTPTNLDDYRITLPDVGTDERGYFNWRLHMRSAR